MRKFGAEWGLAVVLFLGVFVAWFWWGSAAPDGAAASLKIAEAGQHGDWFGSLNALFSGLAFAGLIVTLQFQRRELELQRHELELNRKAVQGSEKQLKYQAKALHKQVELMNLSARLQCLPVLIDQLCHQVDANPSRNLPSAVRSLSEDQIQVRIQRIPDDLEALETELAQATSHPTIYIPQAGVAIPTTDKGIVEMRIQATHRLRDSLQDLLLCRAELLSLYRLTTTRANSPVAPM
jgi:hypothetical protein